RLARLQSQAFAQSIGSPLREGAIDDAITLSRSPDFKYSYLARVVRAGLQEYRSQQRAGTADTREGAERVRLAAQLAAESTSNDLKRGVAGLSTIGATAPFVGLLGAVVGIYNGYRGVSAPGSAGLDAVSSGIAEALVETALGLIVA